MQAYGLFEAVHGDAAHEFGEEVGGFLGHDFVGGGDFHDLFDVAGIEEEGDLGAAGVDGIERGGGFAFVGEIGFGDEGFGGDAESGLENAIVEKDNVEFALERGDVGQELCEIHAGAKSEDVESALLRFRGGIGADGALLAGCDEMREKLLAGFGLGGFIGKWKSFGGEPRLEIAANIGPVEIVEIGDDAVGGENGEAFAARVDKGHHGAFVGGVGDELSCAGAALVAIVQRGFIAMMAVGDDELLILHGFLDGGDAFGFGNDPETVNDIVLIAHFGCGMGAGFDLGENFVDAFLVVGIEKEKLAGVGLGVAQKFEAVGFGTGESVFVAENDACGIFLELAGADEAAAGAALAGAGHSVFLGVGVKSGERILDNDAFANPVLNSGGSAEIDVVLRGVAGKGASFFDGDEIVGIGGVIFFLHGGRDFVVRLREDAVE